MKDIELENALNECKKSAEEGYRIASKYKKNLNKVLNTAKGKIEEASSQLDRSSLNDSDSVDILERQSNRIASDFNRLSYAFDESLDKLRENISKFSITLFGRTTAGKSTLMEFLTKGNGSSIGKGNQRTTLDVRTYVWNGMEVTDVPGICAFGGKDDEQMAFNAAKSADLILFLLTDDGPQADEAEWFSKLVVLGKPIIGIINVRQSIEEDADTEDIIWDIEDRFDMNRLETLKSQFFSFSELYGQFWKDIPFVYVHLLSADQSQRITDETISKKYYSQYEKSVSKLFDFISIFKRDLKGIVIDKQNNRENYVCDLIMDYGSYKINTEFESTGIKKLIKLYTSFNAMALGDIVFIDELDSNLHDVYLCALLEYLMEHGKGQLCFTTHNIGPMDILKRNKKSIDFLSVNHRIYSWTKNGNYSPANLYKGGMIEGSPFNIDSIDFFRAFDVEEGDDE